MQAGPEAAFSFWQERYCENCSKCSAIAACIACARRRPRADCVSLARGEVCCPGCSAKAINTTFHGQSVLNDVLLWFVHLDLNEMFTWQDAETQQHCRLPAIDLVDADMLEQRRGRPTVISTRPGTHAQCQIREQQDCNGWVVHDVSVVRGLPYAAMSAAMVYSLVECYLHMAPNNCSTGGVPASIQHAVCKLAVDLWLQELLSEVCRRTHLASKQHSARLQPKCIHLARRCECLWHIVLV